MLSFFCFYSILFIPNQVRRNKPVVHFVAIDRLCLRNVYGEGVLACCDAFERHLLRNNVGARTPVGAREVGRSDRLLHFLLCVALLADVGSHTLLEPYTRSRVETAERCAVVAPRCEAVNLLAIYREVFSFCTNSSPPSCPP